MFFFELDLIEKEKSDKGIVVKWICFISDYVFLVSKIYICIILEFWYVVDGYI